MASYPKNQVITIIFHFHKFKILGTEIQNLIKNLCLVSTKNLKKYKYLTRINLEDEKKKLEQIFG